jgi:hypothetical protein
VTALRVRHLDEPNVEFGTGTAATIKEGLAQYGPYSLRLGPAHPTAVRVGLVGTDASVAGARSFLKRCSTRILSGRPSHLLAPDFPGFETVMQASLAVDPVWEWMIDHDIVGKALAAPPRRAFGTCLELWATGVHELAERDVRPDVIVCALPKEVLDRCAHIEQSQRSDRRGQQQARSRRRTSGEQLLLFDPVQGSIEAASQPLPEDLVRRDFRRALKAAAMDAKLPIQIATPNLYEEGLRGQQDPASRAWNLSVGLFYKAGGIPWRVQATAEHTCFVGISFHHLRTTKAHVVFSSLAQAFSSEGEGFALRGEALPWDAEDRRPHLGEQQAHDLLLKVVKVYRERLGRNPVRIVIHKTSAFSAEERAGIRRALSSIPVVEMETLRSTEFRLLRQGTYPPHRGTLCGFGSASFLYTTGYSPQRGTYDGPHIPAPLEMAGPDAERAEVAAGEVLALTKMNWNSSDDHTAFPISLAFARKVGLIMSEVPLDQEPHPLYRFYM